MLLLSSHMLQLMITKDPLGYLEPPVFKPTIDSPPPWRCSPPGALAYEEPDAPGLQSPLPRKDDRPEVGSVPSPAD